MSNPRLSQKEAIILDLLSHNGEMYGLEMVSATDQLARGTVYVTLARMAEKGYVQSWLDTAPAPPGPARRIYRVTGYGLKVLRGYELLRTLTANELVYG